jgi:nucleoid-associated protein YgaU
MRKTLNAIIILISIFFITGCTVRTYKVTRKRVDQEITGNRGCLQGECPQIEKKRPSTRDTYIIEFEFGSQLKNQLAPEQYKEEAEKNYSAAISEPTETYSEEDVLKEPKISEETEEYYTSYTVMKDDTLQKISKKFYGTYRKWKKIYEANKDKIKNPDMIEPGIIIRIPK